MKISEYVLSQLLACYPLLLDLGRKQRMLQRGHINDQCSVYIVEDRDEGRKFYTGRGCGWADAIYVVIDPINDNVYVSGSRDLAIEIQKMIN